jgi:putative aldouronate transport system permease protein
MGFPIPIILALLLHNISGKPRFKRFTQTVLYAPHFISLVVLCGMVRVFLSPDSGILSNLYVFLGGEPTIFMADPKYFRHIYVLSGVWQDAGWSAIIYLAALSSIDPQLYEAAKIDGATKFQCILHIDIPGIMNTVIILLILSLGNVMSLGFQKAFLLQSPANLATSELIATYVYKVGLLNAQFSFSTAVSLFNTVINVFLLITANLLSRKITGSSIW